MPFGHDLEDGKSVGVVLLERDGENRLSSDRVRESQDDDRI
jgi:hypothetical protein